MDELEAGGLAGIGADPTVISVEIRTDLAEFSTLPETDFGLREGRLAGATVTTGGAGGVAEFVIAFLATVEVVRATADIAKAARWAIDNHGDVRVAESGIDILARWEIEKRWQDQNPTFVGIHRIPDAKEYVTTYRLHDGRLAVLRYRFDSILISADAVSNLNR